MLRDKSILIANRGEIAVRIIRAAKKLGITTHQIYSDADENSLAVQMADHSHNIGPSPITKSYLNSQAILDLAKKEGIDAIHPGYGFFAENDEFAQKVVNSGIIFIGPDPLTIKTMGNKSEAVSLARLAGIQTIPGSNGIINKLEDALPIAHKLGYPVLIKAAFGGGGRGIRICKDDQEFEKAFLQASLEAKAAFGDGGLYLEKQILDAKHIEVQILSDGKNCIHLYERDCSLQRRRQKVWEEAPCFDLTSDIRNEVCGLAKLLAIKVGYKSAGTIEFLYDKQAENFYFIEMNTRIQVEHPVTEMITGVDIIQEMIKIAFGSKLTIVQEQVDITGHAIEVRINAEDPYANFMPNPGTITDLTIPDLQNIRFDGMIFKGCTIPPFYDSMIGKLIAFGSSREAAIQNLAKALDQFKIEGIKTTIKLYQELAIDSAITSGAFNTNWLEKWLDDKNMIK